MWKNILLFLSLSGLPGRHASRVTRLYRYLDQKMTWADAQRHCRDWFVDLPTVDNPEELMRLQESRNGFAYDSDSMWIGLHDDRTIWQWSHGDRDYKKGQDYGNWWPGTPAFYTAEENCTKITSSGVWIDQSCSPLLQALCIDDEGNYTLVQDTMNWDKAREYCQSQHTELATVRDATDNAKVTAMTVNDTWIGLHRQPWPLWSDGSNATYRNWLTGEPSNTGGVQDCVIMQATTGSYEDVNCEELHYVACQERLRYRLTFKLEMSSEANMTDPEVQRHVLEQLSAKLEQEGVTGAQLIWVLKDGQDQQSLK